MIQNTLSVNQAEINAMKKGGSTAEQQRQIQQIQNQQMISTTNDISNTLNQLTTTLNQSFANDLQVLEDRLQRRSDLFDKHRALSDDHNLSTLDRDFYALEVNYNLHFQLPSVTSAQKELFNGYYPVSKSHGTRADYERLKLPVELPDLLYLPACYCFTSEIVPSKYDSAFYYLRNLKQCAHIAYDGDFYKIKTNKQIEDNINDSMALKLLIEAVKDPPSSTNKMEVLYYYHAYIWIGYLQNKNAKTLSDLESSIEVMKKFNSRNVYGYDIFEQDMLSSLNKFIDYFSYLSKKRKYMIDGK